MSGPAGGLDAGLPPRCPAGLTQEQGVPAAEADSSLCKGTPSLGAPTSRDWPGRDAVSVTTAPQLKASATQSGAPRSPGTIRTRSYMSKASTESTLTPSPVPTMPRPGVTGEGTGREGLGSPVPCEGKRGWLAPCT